MGTKGVGNAGSGRHDELLHACRLLFGPEVVLSHDFLWYLQPQGAQKAYRQRVREHHPDRHPGVSLEQQTRLHHDFIHLTNAYELLRTYLAERGTVKQGWFAEHASSASPSERPTPPETCRRSATSTASAETYYQGAIPAVELKIGRYLYFRGKVSYQSVLQALQWQRAQRPSIGLLARQWGWLDEHEVHLILRSETVGGRFGERARGLGLLTGAQVDELLVGQQALQQRLGRYYVDQGRFTELQLLMLEHERRMHNSQVYGGNC